MVHDCGRFLILALCCLGCLRADAQGDTQRGVAVGGITGAIAGGLIGDHNGEAGAGAAIGGLIGAVTGGMIGNASDKEAEFRRQQALAFQHQQQLAHQQSAVSVQDVVSMSRSGLSDLVIINQINQRGVRTRLQVPDIISLHQQGVSEPVISAMQQAPTGAVPAARLESGYEVVQPVPVIVQEHYILPHYAPPRRYYYYRPAYHHHRHSHHFGF